jgi:prepilin-type N-terminal cleavage/methylation domain-containing protein
VRMAKILTPVRAALQALPQNLPIERAFSPSLYYCPNPGASPQAGMVSRLQRLNPIEITNWKRQRRALYQPGAKPQEIFATGQPRAEGPFYKSFEAAPGEPSSQNVRGRRLRASSGFTLLEVLVALTVFAVGAAIMLSLISGSLGNIRKVQLRTRTIQHAEAVMELALLDESIQGPTSFTGDFEDGTRWSVFVEDYVLPDTPDLLPDGRQITMPVKFLSYTIEMFSPGSTASDYSLQTLKLVRTTPGNNLVRMP